VLVAQILTHSLTASLWVSWSRNWAGRVMSIVVLTPLITTWFKYRKPFRWNVRALLTQKPFEALAAFLFFGLTIYAVFWTALPQVNVFVILYVLLGGLFWIALRLGPRMTATALFFMAAAGIAGTIIANPTHAHLNTQLLADELFTVLLAPLFLVLAALVEERRVTANELSKNVAELHEAMQKLESEDRSKNEFIATLAHELRNPLAPVVSTLEILELREHEPESLSLINGAQEQMATMRKLLDDLLDVTRVTRGSFQIEKAAVELQTAMHQSVRTVEPFMWQQEHSLSVSLPSKPIWIFGDPVRISQICTNILYNAAKYTPPGGKISLSVLERGSNAMLTITDNGIGIPEDRLESIFEPFNQGDKRSSVGSGLGIGLSLTRHLVGLHDGTIEAFSKGVGHGSTFIVYLPMYVNNEVPMPQTENKDALVILPPPSSRRILVVDDNQAAAHGLERLLTYKGYTVDVVYDGESALKEASVFAPDVVLLDIGLPGMDGYEVARRLIREDGSIPSLIAITGYGQEEDKRKAFEAGFNYHLTKPVGIAEIEDILVSL
jgi:signal transduction histidine kinase/CheY-like chemotaxis protein